MDIRGTLYQGETQDYKQTFSSSVSAIAAAGGTAFLVNKFSSYIPTGFKRENLRYLQGFTINGTPWNEFEGMRFKTKSASLRDVVWNTIKGVEETLFKIPRTFSLSTIYGSGVYQDARFEVPGGSDILKQQKEYLKKISAGRILDSHIQEGIVYDAGKILAKDGTVLVEHASMVPGVWNDDYMSKVGRALFEEEHLKAPKLDTFFTGGQTRKAAVGRKIEAWMNAATKRYMALMDNPFEVIAEIVDSKTSFFNLKKKAQWLNKNIMDKMLLRNQFGVGGEAFLKGSWRDMWRRHLTKGMPKIALGLAAVGVVNEVTRAVTGTTPLGLLAQGYQGVSQAVTAVSDATGMTGFTQAQEKIAPGSTHLMGLASIPLAGAIFGGTIGKLTDIAARTPLDLTGEAPRWFKNIASSMDSAGGFQKKIADTLKLGSKGRVGALAITGAAVGAALALPFLPGALGSSKTYEEREKIYSGKEWVPVREGRFWEMGLTPHEGGDVQFHAPHWTVRAITDARERGIAPEGTYGDFLGNFVKSIADPYWKEKALDSERPYVYWGPSDIGLGVAEKLINPLKELFKPVVLAHPEVFDEGALESTAAAMEGGGVKAQMVPSYLSAPEGTPAQDAVNSNFLNLQIEQPNSLKSYVAAGISNAISAGGLQTFALKGMAENIVGPKGALQPEAQWETSGRIDSMQRRFWDENIGGGFGMTEAYRRMNPDRPYNTEYMHSPIRNEMPSWMPERLKFGDPYCISLDTLVEVDELNFVAGKDVAINTQIVNHLGKNTSVGNLAVRKVGKDEKTYSLKVASLTGVDMKFSEDHPIYTCKNIDYVRDYKCRNKDNSIKKHWGEAAEYEWVPIRDIKPGDYVAYPKPKINTHKIVLDIAQYVDLPFTDEWIFISNMCKKGSNFYTIYEFLTEHGIQRFKYGQRKKFLDEHGWTEHEYESAVQSIRLNIDVPKIKRYIEIDADIAYLFGLYLAEGHVSSGHVSLALSSDEEDLFKRALIGAQKIQPNCTYSFKKIDGTNGANGNIYSKVVKELLVGLFSKHSKNKSISNMLAYLDDITMLSMLRGYIDGDGCYFEGLGGDYYKDKNKKQFRVCIKSANLKLLLQVRKILLRFDIVASIVKNKPQQTIYKEKEINSGVSYNLLVRGNSAVDLAGLLGYDAPEKTTKYGTWSYVSKDYILLRVISNNEIKEVDEVVGYFVPEDNSFCVSGIATHNTQIDFGELRLPGRGYAALYPELEGVNPEDYPMVHRMAILNDVAPKSPSYYHAANYVDKLSEQGLLNEDGQSLYQEVLRRREEKEAGPEFDYGGTGVGDYWLGVKKMARSLPTESLYPLSPAHKLAGPVDPITEYKSFEVLDKSHKQWSSPVGDYVKPAFNRMIDSLAVGTDYVPGEKLERDYFDSYFMGLQAQKNKVLGEKADMAFKSGNYQLGRFYDAGKKDTAYGMDTLAPREEVIPLLPERQQKYADAFMNTMGMDRARAASMASPEIRQMMIAQDVGKSIGPINGVGQDMESIAPERDWTGYAPGVDLNAFKVKSLDALGQNIREHNLWKGDEHKAVAYDNYMNEHGGGEGFLDSNVLAASAASQRTIGRYIGLNGMRETQVDVIPTYGKSTTDISTTQNNKRELKGQMRDMGIIRY